MRVTRLQQILIGVLVLQLALDRLVSHYGLEPKE